MRKLVNRVLTYAVCNFWSTLISPELFNPWLVSQGFFLADWAFKIVTIINVLRRVKYEKYRLGGRSITLKDR